MSAALKLLLALVAFAAPAAARAQERQEVRNLWTLAEGAPMAERQVARGRPFYQQPLYVESNLRRGFGIQFDLTPQQLDALRDRHDMDDDQPFILADWLARTPGSDAPPRHLGYLHCSLHLRLGVGVVSVCLRDGDADGRLDGVVTFAANRFPPEGLRFEPIAPVGYRYVPQDRALRGRERWGEDRFGLAYDFDRATGRLVFSIDLFGPGLPAEFKPSVEVDPGHLPATVELGGAQLTVLAWDGRRATVRVDRPFPARLLRLIDEQRGSQRGWHPEEVNAPLPGAAG